MNTTKETFGNNPRNWEGDFNVWMKAVNQLLAKELLGLDSEDLPDQNYWDMWNDGMSPSEGYREVIASLVEFDGLDEEFLS